MAVRVEVSLYGKRTGRLMEYADAGARGSYKRRLRSDYHMHVLGKRFIEVRIPDVLFLRGEEMGDVLFIQQLLKVSHGCDALYGQIESADDIMNEPSVIVPDDRHPELGGILIKGDPEPLR